MITFKTRFHLIDGPQLYSLDGNRATRGFFTNDARNMRPQRDEPRIAVKRERPWSRKINVDNLTNATRLCRHDHGAIGEVDGFLDIVRDEDHCLAIGLPEFQQEVLHQGPRQGVERTEWLVHDKNLGIDRKHAGDCGTLAHAAR